MEPIEKKKKRSKSRKGRPKRIRKQSQSDDESSGVLSAKYAEPPISKIYNFGIRKHTPAELFRKDLISAMKLPDSEPLCEEDYWIIEDPWKLEWERGVQVPVEPEALPEPCAIEFRKRKNINFKLPKKLLRTSKDKEFSPSHHCLSFTAAFADQVCRYDMDDVDHHWLKIINEDRSDHGLEPIEESVMEKIMEEIEDVCSDNIMEALQSTSNLNMETDEDAICDVCRSPDSEDGNEMVFCDSCNICVHQSCYGITTIPEGSWICRTCALGVQPVCVLCPNKGGAMKPTKSGDMWCHVSCAIWVPEVSISSVEKMEPITKISNIPHFRWDVVCFICEEKGGACIQCSVKSCKVSYHVTCAFKSKLRMRAIMSDSEGESLKLKSYCRKHTKDDSVPSLEESEVLNKREFEMTGEEKHITREARLKECEVNFVNYASLEEVCNVCSQDRDIVESIYNYWILKRRANFNRSLTQPREVNGGEYQNSTFHVLKRIFTLRRDLERARNLCYMITKREKVSKSWIKAHKEVFHKQAWILSHFRDKLNDAEQKAVLLANYGDLAYDKVHNTLSGPTPNTLNVMNALIGEENSKSQLYGMQKMRRKRDKSLEKMPNPYAKHYLNGLLKRSQRWLVPTDHQKCLMADADNLSEKSHSGGSKEEELGNFSEPSFITDDISDVSATASQSLEFWDSKIESCSPGPCDEGPSLSNLSSVLKKSNQEKDDEPEKQPVPSTATDCKATVSSDCKQDHTEQELSKSCSLTQDIIKGRKVLNTELKNLNADYRNLKFLDDIKLCSKVKVKIKKEKIPFQENSSRQKIDQTYSIKTSYLTEKIVPAIVTSEKEQQAEKVLEYGKEEVQKEVFATCSVSLIETSVHTDDCKLIVAPDKNNLLTEEVKESSSNMFEMVLGEFIKDPSSESESQSHEDISSTSSCMEELKADNTSILSNSPTAETPKSLSNNDTLLPSSKTDLILQKNSSSHIKNQNFSIAAKEHHVNKHTSFTAKVGIKQEDSKLDESPNTTTQKVGTLTGYKIPKKSRCNTAEEPKPNTSRVSSPLSPLVDRTPPSPTHTSKIMYSPTNSYQQRRGKSPATKDLSPKVMKDISPKVMKHVHSPSSIHSSDLHSHSSSTENRVKKLNPQNETFQWRTMSTGERVDITSQNWRYFQSVPKQRLYQEATRPHRNWRKPLHSYRPRPQHQG